MVAQRQPMAIPVCPDATRLRIEPPSHSTDRLKRACDLSVGLVMLVAALPIIAVTWLAVRLTSRGPGFYSQMRVGATADTTGCTRSGPCITTAS